MADNFEANPGVGGGTFAADDVGGVLYPRTKISFGADGAATDVDTGAPLPVTLGGATVAVSGTFYQATQPVSIAGTVAVSGPLTDVQLRAAAVPVSGTFWQATQPISAAALPLPAGAATAARQDTIIAALGGTLAVSGTFWQATQPVSGPLTDAQLRAVAVPVSGTFWQATQPVSGPLTDAQLRAVAVPVSGTFWQATQPVSGPLTDVQLRASAVPVSLASVPTHAVTQSGSWNVTLLAGTANIGDVDVLTLPALVAGSAVIGKVGIDNTTPGTTDGVVNKQFVEAAGTLSALDAVVAAPAGAGQAVTGTPTAGSYVGFELIGGEAAVGCQLNGGNWTGTAYFEGSNNATSLTSGNWISIMGQRLGINETTLTNGHTAAGAGIASLYRLMCAGFRWVRIRLVGSAFSANTTITFVHSPGAGNAVLTGSLPAGDNNIGNVDIASAIPAGANEIGGVNVTKLAGTAVSVNVGTPDAGTQRIMPPTPTNHAHNSAASTNATSIKASAGTVYGIVCNNVNAAVRYVKFYNLAVAPTVGTSVPMFTIAVPATSTVSMNLGALGIRFGTGIAIAITTGMADGDTAAVAANEIKVVTSYV